MTPAEGVDLAAFGHLVRQKVDAGLEHILSLDTCGSERRIVEAMHYASLGGGKRVRPLLCFASADLFNPGALDNNAVLSAACSVELIHAYSLVHDDLPAMDDDDLRRGRPTVHKQFDEATAILAGDGLQTLAFEVLSDCPDMSAQNSVQAIKILAGASGKKGMAGGQMIDIVSAGQSLTLDALIEMHKMKTGALIRASVLLGALAAGCKKQSQLDALDRYAEQIGLAFQIQDDILDCTSTTEVLGKRQGADIELDKPTYVSLLGLEGARNKLATAHKLACDALQEFDENSLLQQMADYIVSRTH